MRSLNQNCVWKGQRRVKEWEEAPLSLYLKMVVLIKLFVRGFCFLHSLQWGWWGGQICYTHLKDEETEACWVGVSGQPIAYGPRLEEASDSASVFLGIFFPCSQATQWPERKSELGNLLKQAIKETFLLPLFPHRYSLGLITLWIFGV